MKVAAWLARIGIALCLLALTLLFLGLVILPMVMGWQAYSVHSNDMAPTVPSGSQMYVRPLHGDEAITVKARDVIAYSPKDDPQDTVVKRVSRVDGVGAGRTWTVRGDANKEESVVRPDQLRGDVVLFVPYLGAVADLLAKQPLVMGGCLLGSLMLFTAMVLWSRHITAKREAEQASAAHSGANQLSDVAPRAPGGTRPPSAPATMPPASGTRPPAGGRAQSGPIDTSLPPSQSLPSVQPDPSPRTGSHPRTGSQPRTGAQPRAGAHPGTDPRTGSQPGVDPRTGSAPRTGTPPTTGHPAPAAARPPRPAPEPAPHYDPAPPEPNHHDQAGLHGEDAHLAAWGQPPHPDGPRPLDDASPPPAPTPAPPRPAGAYVVATPPEPGRGGTGASGAYQPYTQPANSYRAPDAAQMHHAPHPEDLRRFEEQRRAEEEQRRRDDHRREEQRRADDEYWRQQEQRRADALTSWRHAADDDPNKPELQRIFEAALRERGLPIPPPTSATPIVAPPDRGPSPSDRAGASYREASRDAGWDSGRDSAREPRREQPREPRRPSSPAPRVSPHDELSGPPTGFFAQVLAESGLDPNAPPRRPQPSEPEPRAYRPDPRPEAPRGEDRPASRPDPRHEPRHDPRPETGHGMDSLSLLESWRTYSEKHPDSEAGRVLFPDAHTSGWGSNHSGVQPQVGPDGLRTWGQPIVPELRPHSGYGNESRYLPEPPTKPPITGAMRRISSTQYVFEDDPRTSGNATTHDPDRSGPLSLFRRRQGSSSDQKRGRRDS